MYQLGGTDGPDEILILSNVTAKSLAAKKLDRVCRQKVNLLFPLQMFCQSP